MGKALNLKQCGGHLIVAHRLRCLLKRFGRCAVTTFSIAQFDEFIDILGIFCIFANSGQMMLLEKGYYDKIVLFDSFDD